MLGSRGRAITRPNRRMGVRQCVVNDALANGHIEIGRRNRGASQMKEGGVVGHESSSGMVIYMAAAFWWWGI